MSDNYTNTEQHSEKFYDIQKHYKDGFWNAKMVKNAVVKGKITEEEYNQIVNA
jgi:uncharacterized membrane protein